MGKERRLPGDGPEPAYSRAELMAGARELGVGPEVVAGALRLAGRQEMTRREAEAAIRQFLERRV